MSASAGRNERYAIQSELGRGGMGVVFAAYDNVRRQPVALKRLLRSSSSSAAELERSTTLFEREYHTLSQLAHPHVISVFDYGIDAEGPYYTMEQLRGESLRARSPLPWREAAALIRDVASALAIVHSRRLIHRDVTPQNIYSEADGGVKLIDFGAMIPMGVAKQLVGTPAFMAPECLQSQPLDGQTDLFALGACLYFAISGRNAYAARGVDSLALAWQRPPSPLSQHAPDVPEALEALVASLLSVQPAGRPRTAADVYEQLTSIAELPRSESAQIARAYLTKPALVGRENELAELRRLLERARKRRGTSVLITGPAGIGRSRLLDASLLEAQLAGMRIARADASDAQDRPLGVIARLLHNLHEGGLDPGPTLQRFELTSLLAGDGSELLGESRRQQTLRDLTRVVIELAEHSPLMIAVDDLHAMDDPSLAVLAGLAAQVRASHLSIVCTLAADAQARPNAALRLLRESSRQLVLGPLDDEQSRLLLSSVFGDAPNLEVFSALCQRRCLGNPQRLMESAQAAISAEIARYEGGGWAITDDATAIGATLDRQTDIEQQLAELSMDAVELLELISFDRESMLNLADYAALTEHADNARTHRALSELLSSDWLVIHGDRARFRRDGQRLQLVASVPPSRARAIHGLLATRCAKPGMVPLYRAYHLVRAGLLEQALSPMDEMTAYVDTHASADIVRSPITLEALEIFSELSDVQGAHPGARANYAAAFAVNAAYQGFPDRAAPRFEYALRTLAPFTGVADYRELHHLPESERLTQALTRANERCQQPGIGGLDLVHAIRRQTQLCVTVAVCANLMADTSLLAGLPDLRPFEPLSPALAVARRVLDGLCNLARGQTWLAWDAFEEVRSWVFSPQGESIDPLTLVALKVGCLGYLCAVETEHAAPNTLAHLELYAPLMPHNAQSQRARYYLATGDLAASAAARKQSELLSVQSNSLLETRNTDAASYLGMHALSDDLLGLKRAHVVVAEVTKTRPGWSFRLGIAQCHVLRCQGREAEALALAESTLTGVPTLHADFAAAAATHLELLLVAGRAEEARETARAYLERARAHDVPSFRIELSLALAQAELGEHEPAERSFAAALHALEARQVAGLLLGRALETGARVALRRGDARAFAERAERCSIHYSVRQNPALGARHAKLLREAVRAGLIASEPTPALGAELRELASISADSEFYSGALEYLVKRSGTAGGYLYVASSDGLRRVAGTHASQWSDSELDRVAAECYAREHRAAESSADTPTKDAEQSSTGPDLSLWPCALACPHVGGRTIEGVVLFVANAQTGAGIPRSNLEQLATLMTLRCDSTTSPPL